MNGEHRWVMNGEHRWVMNGEHRWVMNGEHRWVMNGEHRWVMNGEHRRVIPKSQLLTSMFQFFASRFVALAWEPQGVKQLNTILNILKCIACTAEIFIWLP